MDGIVSVLSKTTSLVLTITGSPTFKEIVASVRDYEKETKMLAETIGFIGDLLSDVEGLQFQEKSSEVNAYNRLRIAYLDAQDFLDVIQTAKKKLEAEDMLIKQAEQEIVHKANEKGTRLGSLASAPIKIKTFTKKTSRFFGIRKFTKAHYEIMEIKRNLDAISEDLNKFGLRKVSSKESIATRSRAKGAFVNERSIIGRDEDKRKVIDLLLGACIDEELVPVISIVGIGGMGKTTVAQLVYDDKSQLESCKFDLKLWVSDSQQFDLKVLLQKILKSISSDDTSLQSLEIDSLQSRLREKIDGKKYLLVLDDVENESREDWTELEELLKLGAKGSRVLVTTRSRRVAKVMSSDSMIYELDCLSKEDSWLLFERMAFKGSKDEKLVQIGKDVFQKCGGVPLAIKTIGCLLYGQADNKWERVRLET